MSEEKINSEAIFERKIKLCEDFCYFESMDDVIISFNASSGKVNIWAYYNKNWNAEGGTEILNTLLKCRKLDLVGYLPWNMKKISCNGMATKKKQASISPNA